MLNAMTEPINTGVRNLLDLHDSILDQGDGYWIKIEAWAVAPNMDVPHGIRYSLTLHEPYGKRILGYDNAHRVKPHKKFKYAGQRLPYDLRTIGTAMQQIWVFRTRLWTPITY